MKARHEIRITHLARQDMAAILDWTREHFGTRQRKAYARILALAMRALADDPEVAGARPAEYIAPGIHLLHVARGGRKGRHIIVFRVNAMGARVDVLRVLHDSMDLMRHMPD
ncbi:MAG TPA: type II toxin-antitoxin system RelE/ParE family toxin [Rhodanobacteraceae bacterium]|nr:type II toxin-antitoxin system RelE/ParE family toxin [Rhodanobacteraceae bacterium]